MIKTERNRMIELSSKDLTLYTFVANFNPIYGCDEPEATLILIAGTDIEDAKIRLEWLVGGKGRASKFYLVDSRPYM